MNVCLAKWVCVTGNRKIRILYVYVLHEVMSLYFTLHASDIYFAD